MWGQHNILPITYIYIIFALVSSIKYAIIYSFWLYVCARPISNIPLRTFYADINASY